MSDNIVLATFPDSEVERTRRPDLPISDFVWDNDILRHVGSRNADMTAAFSRFTPAMNASFKNAVVNFISKGDYSPFVYHGCFSIIASSLRRHPSNRFDEDCLAHALVFTSFRRNIGCIRNFFIHWNQGSPNVIDDSVLQMLVKLRYPKAGPSNVLSDDPELSWLTDTEYETLLISVWRNYENESFSVTRTLTLLLSMQYARRPVQLAQLKFGDFRVALADDSSGLMGPVVAFPGAKDVSAETNFRDSKFETHPIPEHLWNLAVYLLI